MKKLLAILLSVLMIASFAACSGNGEKPAADGGNKPEITGVQDLTVEAGHEIDVLEGVAATDAEDGDLTSMITIESSPALSFKGGKATPETAGTYELVYSVTDKSGETSEAYATLTATKQTAEAILLKDFDFSTVEATDAKGWKADIAEGVKATGGLKEGSFVFDIENPGDGDGAIRFVKSGFAVKGGADYKIRIWAKSTVPTYAHFIAKNELAEGWVTFGDIFNVRIDENVRAIELNFTAAEDGSAELMLNLGKITPNPDNPDDTTPENFTVTIDKVDIYEITGEENETPVYTAEFTDNGAFVESGDGAEASVSFADGAAIFDIASYPTEGGVWSIKANLEIPGVVVEKDAKYSYSFTAVAENGQGGECLVESASQYDKVRANFNGISMPAGEETVVTGYFTAENTVEDPVIRMQIGNPDEGVTSNKITIKDFVFNKIDGEKEITPMPDVFAPIGKFADVDKETYPWETFNGTDEDHEGVGTIWVENGSLFYRIDQGGTVDWYNKLYCVPVLPADSYFEVEITAKADKNVSCSFILNPKGSWDPRIIEGINFTTEEQTFTFRTTETLITDMEMEMLFQFGSQETAELGEVTIEFTNIKIYQIPVM